MTTTPLEALELAKRLREVASLDHDDPTTCRALKGIAFEAAAFLERPVNTGQGVGEETRALVEARYLEVHGDYMSEEEWLLFEDLHAAVRTPLASVEQRYDGVPISVHIGAEVRRRNRVGDDDEKGAISPSCEMAATEIVLAALADCGFVIQRPPPLASVEGAGMYGEFTPISVGASTALAQSGRSSAEPVAWLWYGTDEAGKTHVSFGRWQNHVCQHRYKYAEVQPTEHDHPSPVGPQEVVAVSAQNPRVIIAGIRQFGLAADGSDLRDLEAALSPSGIDLGGEVERLTREIDRLRDCLRDRPNTVLLAYEDGDHQRLARAAAKAIDAREAAEARLATAEKAGELGELAKHINWELDWGERDPNDEFTDCGWRVHKRTGNRNDREWSLIGYGVTPVEALREALASLSNAVRDGDDGR